MIDSSLLGIDDDQIIKRYKIDDHWGLSVGLDLVRCNADKICDENIIRDFSIGLCDYIKISRSSEPTITKIINNPKKNGISLLQYLENSKITAFFKEFDSNASIDIFKCGSYAPYATSAFCKKYFNAQKVNIKYITYRD